MVALGMYGACQAPTNPTNPLAHSLTRSPTRPLAHSPTPTRPLPLAHSHSQQYFLKKEDDGDCEVTGMTVTDRE